MRSFVTGASGFVGGHLVPRLLREGPVTVLRRPGVPGAPAGCAVVEGDVAEPAHLEAVPPMDVVVHLAAEASPERAQRDPETAFRTNVEGTQNVVDLAARHGARLVFLSTGQVYGTAGGKPLAEDAPLRPQGVYAATKAAAEERVAEAREDGLAATALRCFNMYGPGQVGPYVVPAMMEALRKGETPRLRDLAPARDFLYIGDAVEAMALAALRPDAPDALNVAAGRTWTIAEVARAACAIAGVPAPTGPFANADKVEVDVSRLRALGWQPRVPLEEGLRRTLEWWKAAA